MNEWKFFDRNGTEITHERWNDYRNDTTYSVIETYEMGKIRIVVEWLGVERVGPLTGGKCYDYYQVMVYESATSVPKVTFWDSKEKARGYAGWLSAIYNLTGYLA